MQTYHTFVPFNIDAHYLEWLGYILLKIPICIIAVTGSTSVSKGQILNWNIS